MSTLPRPALSRRAKLSFGQPISDLMARALANPQLISLAAGFVDQSTLPCAETEEALRSLWADPVAGQKALQYGTTAGYPPLRQTILEQQWEADQTTGIAAPSIDQVVLTAGSNQLLHLVAESLLDPGDLVLCSSPTYFVFLGTLQNLGAVPWGVDSDEQGILPEALEEALRRIERKGQLDRVKAIYLVSYSDNPRGITLPAARREKIIALCQRWSTKRKIYVIDDMAYRLLRYHGPDVPSLLHYDPTVEYTVACGTFSKSFSPGLRVGWGILPKELVEPVCSQKGNFDFGSPNFNQHLMHEVIRLGLFDAHVRRIRHAYGTKLAVILEAAEQFLGALPGIHWIRPQGGLYLWVELPQTIDTGPNGRLFNQAIEEGVLYVPGEYCFPTSGPLVRRNTMRLSFGVQTPARIELGMQALSRALRGVLEDPEQ